MRAGDCVPLVEVTRGEIVESIHYGAFCVVDAQGRVLASEGNPDLMTYPRSSMKPFQALPFIEREGDLAFSLAAQEIAIMCASHSGTDMHRSVLEGMHAKIGLTEADLACGVHWPNDAATRDAMKKAGEEPTPFRHNCSGKHTGMLAFAKLLGVEKEDYLNPQHPVQVIIRETLAEMIGLPSDSLPLGTDGCSAPVYGIPLRNMAHAVAKLVEPDNLGDSRAAACKKITSAMMMHPMMVAGPGRFDTELMMVAAGKLVCKGGAEAYQIIGVMPGVLRKDSPGMGIAVKISDGDPHGRAVSAVSLEILSALGALSDNDLLRLSAFGSKQVQNWRKITVGKFRTVFSLEAI